MKVSFLFFVLANTIQTSTLNFSTNAQQIEYRLEDYKSSAAATAEYPFNVSKKLPEEFIECENIVSERTFELCLQKEATNAALESANILRWQTWIGGLALLSAVAAAVFSWFAVRQARKGVAVALKVGIAEIRPYLKLNISVSKKDVEVYSKKGNTSYEVIYSINNIGKSEAFLGDTHCIIDTVSSKDKFVTKDIFDFKNSDRRTEAHEGINDAAGENLYVYPHQEPKNFVVDITDNSIEKILSRDEDFIFALLVYYNDSIGIKYKANYVYRACFKKSEAVAPVYSLTKHSPIRLQQDYTVEIPNISLGRS